MSGPFVPGVGAVFSADIAVPEHEREMRFYSRMLNTGENPLWRPDLMNNAGMPIIGLGARVAEYAHLPLQWMPHIQVADVASSVERALKLGGKELMHSKSASGTSQWAVLLDPNGAAFGVVPVTPAEAIPPVAPTTDAAMPMGRITWFELTVPDAHATQAFYRHVVGWSVQEVVMNDDGGRYTDYQLLREDESPVGAIRNARGANVGLPSVWMIHLPVGDLAQSVRRAQEDGGKLLRAVRDEAGGFAYAAIQDPVGACTSLVTAHAADG